MKLTQSCEQLLRCPICKSRLELGETRLTCISGPCGASFPIVNEVPVLLNEAASVFCREDYVEHQSAKFSGSPRTPLGRLRRRIRKVLPEIGSNVKAQTNYATFARLLLAQVERPRVLVIGGRILGHGMNELAANRNIELIETDVSFGPRTALICDAHDLPFPDESMDGVIIQAVLHHVVDPNRCVDEIHRVCTATGLVYSDTPFMQQVHGGAYDFTRFTQLGHRRLFRKFEEIDSGSVGGPGIALAWSWQYFLRGFASTRTSWQLLSVLACCTGFWLKYIDRYLLDRPAALDGAWGFYFLGRKSDQVLSDRELVRLYQGMAGPTSAPHRGTAPAGCGEPDQ